MESLLPEYARPPLNELVLGVQFATPQFYSPAMVTEVWSLFRNKFERAEVQSPLAARFETFGGLRTANQPSFQVFGAPPAPRYWFLTNSGDGLVQFQLDRLLHNWRQLDGIGGEYPRFHNVVREFSSELEAFVHFVDAHGERLSINQAEISYINRIYDDEDPGQLPSPSKWLSFVDLEDIETASGELQRVVKDESGQPVGRLFIEYNGAYDYQQRPLLNLTLTFRGAPSGTTQTDAIEFLRRGHEIIVHAFTEVTTEKAHTVWQRQR